MNIDTMHNSIAQLEDELPLWMAEKQVTGLSLAVIDRSSVVWKRAFGVKHAGTGEPVRENAP